MRNKFDEQLENLNIILSEMGTLCENAISCATRCLIDHSAEMKIKTMETEKQIDQKERDTEALCMRLLIHQQPVASDFRMITSALKMIYDMERIGDQAGDIAEIAEYIVDYSEQPLGRIISDMSETALYMVTNSVGAFTEKDIYTAAAVIRMDDKMDQQFLHAKKQLIKTIQSGNSNAEALTDILMIAKYFERIGDHAESIARWVIYSVTGEHK